MNHVENAIVRTLQRMQQDDLLTDENVVAEDFLTRMDSITLMSFFLFLEEELQTSLSWAGIKKQMTYREFVDYLNNQREGA